MVEKTDEMTGHAKVVDVGLMDRNKLDDRSTLRVADCPAAHSWLEGLRP